MLGQMNPSYVSGFACVFDEWVCQFLCIFKKVWMDLIFPAPKKIKHKDQFLQKIDFFQTHLNLLKVFIICILICLCQEATVFFRIKYFV